MFRVFYINNGLNIDGTVVSQQEGDKFNSNSGFLCGDMEDRSGFNNKLDRLNFLLTNYFKSGEKNQNF